MARTKLVLPRKKQVFGSREELVDFMTKAGWEPEGEGINPNTKEFGNGFRDASTGAWVVVYSDSTPNGIRVTDIKEF